MTTAGATSQGDSGEPVRILEEVQDYSYKDRFRIFRARLQYRRSDGRLSDPVTRLNFERGRAAAVLLYDPAADSVVLVRQFRYPVYATVARAQGQHAAAEQAWLLEIIAGVEDDGQAPADVARREAQEETGYDIRGELTLIARAYVSPGASSEQVSIFLGEVDSRARSGRGGGLPSEGEDTEIVVLPRTEALAMLAHGEIADAKTIIALQYLALARR